jgi:hypothetical protein
MVINLVLESSLELLNRGFELELYMNHELPMVFNYIRYLYQLMEYNRRPKIIGMCDDIAKLNLINFEDLDASAAKFKQKRKKFTALQKLVCDEHELFRALHKIYSGMTIFAIHCLKEGIISNIIGNEGVEKSVYENRFGQFAAIPFPRYLSYQEYQEFYKGMTESRTAQQLLDQAKKDFIDGKNILQKLIDTDEGSRNTKILSK